MSFEVRLLLSSTSQSCTAVAEIQNFTDCRELRVESESLLSLNAGTDYPALFNLVKAKFRSLIVSWESEVQKESRIKFIAYLV
jgi:hypothetical protein